MQTCDLKGKKVLIVGEAGSGKTSLTLRLLKELEGVYRLDDFTVLDFAPRRIVSAFVTGGRLKDLAELRYRYLSSDEIRGPRLEGKAAADVIRIAKENSQITTKMILDYLSNPTKLLAINDLTIHLHYGDLKLLEDAILNAETFIGSAYQGRFLKDDKGTGISLRESGSLQELKRLMNHVIMVGKEGPS